jgi:hypothetical protein
LGQLLPALFATACEDFPSSSCPRAGKKAMLVTTFSFGRLVCSFHEAWIIVNFVCNIQRFISHEKRFFAGCIRQADAFGFFSVSSWTNCFFVVECTLLLSLFAPLLGGEHLFF